MKKLLILLMLTVFTSVYSQVGIGTPEPQAMLHIAGNFDNGEYIPGDLVIEDVPIVSVTDVKYILVYTENDSKVKRIDIASLSIGKCPTVENNSQYNLKFISDFSIPNPNEPIQITVGNITKPFTVTSTTINGNKYHYRYTNSTGYHMNLNNGFTANFSGLICQY